MYEEKRRIEGAQTMPETYATFDRFLYFATPLGEDKLALKQFAGFEGISEIYRFQLDFQAKNDVDVKFDQLIGKEVSFGVVGRDFPALHRAGIVIECSQGNRGTELTDYGLVVVPKLWTLTQKVRSRIFQQKNIPDILRAVLTGIDAEYQFEGTYNPREFVVQYRESDYDFACRLMEEEGMYYYFKFNDKGNHKLVVTDLARLTTDVPDKPQIKYDAIGGGGAGMEPKISDFRRTQNWRSGKVTLWDHHFQLPHRHNDAEKQVVETITAGTVAHKLKLNGNEQFEIYDYPGEYARWHDGIDKGGGEQASEIGKISQAKTRIADIRLQQEEVQMLAFLGGSDCRHLVPGFKFTLQEHYNANGAYILTSISHSAREGSYRSGQNEVSSYENTFTCIPQTLKYRTPRRTPKPRVAGCQTAVVVGPSGEEIFTDKYGRVKVQFHWDRDGQNDQNSSCWLRVATPWSGAKWGTVHIPRVNMEVLVDFLEGDPDKPIIIGSLYNDREMPPYTLPDNKTQSGIKSRSSKGGGPDNYNELRFEDKKGSEMITFHAEKDMEREVEHDDRIDIGNDQKFDVHHDRKKTIDNDEKVEIKNNRTNKIGQKHQEEIGGDHLQEVKMNKKVKVGMNYNIESGMNITIKAGIQLNIESGVAITFKAGASSLQINPGGIQMAGTPMMMLNCPGPPPMPIMPVIIPPLMPGMPAPPAMPGAPAMPAMPAMPGMQAPAAPAAPSMPSVPNLPPLPDPAAMASQVTTMTTSALDTATNVLGNMANTFMDQVSNTATTLVNSAANMGQMAAAAAGQIANQVQQAVDQAKEQVGKAVAEAKEKVNDAVDAVTEQAQQAVAQTAQQVSDLQNQAAQALDNAQQQLQDTAAQAQQMANQAAEQGQQALQQASQQAAQVAEQAQQVAQQAQQQLQDTAQQAQQAAANAAQQGQQALNATSQQVNALAQQGQQAAAAAQQAAQQAAGQAQAAAQQAMAQGQEAATQMANQASQAAQQAQQAAAQAAGQAQQAAAAAAQNAQQMAQQTQQQVQQATQQATQQVQQAAQQAGQQAAAAAQQATQQAAAAGQMAQQQAAQVSQQVGNAASQASNQIGQTAEQAFGQVGSTANQAAQGVQNAFGGLGK
jgi:type VI secretion system secreted protein VgrG